jgi:hypothetical protein
MVAVYTLVVITDVVFSTRQMYFYSVKILWCSLPCAGYEDTEIFFKRKYTIIGKKTECVVAIIFFIQITTNRNI